MYFDLPSTLAYTKALSTLSSLAHSFAIDLFLIPDFTTLHPASAILSSTAVLLGAQNTSPHTTGPYTGEVSPRTLSQLGVRIVEIGHAERRALFHETDADVAAKASAVVQHGMIPLVCIGEKATPGSVASRAVGLALLEVIPQIKAVFAAVPPDAEIVLAYEPVWAIGAKEPAGSDHVLGVIRGLRTIVDGFARTGVVRILYGGSAGPGTWAGLRGVEGNEGVDGLFLGRFGHEITNLEKVILEIGEA